MLVIDTTNTTMSWTRPALSFAQGAAITLGSTAVSCALALQVEQSAHRLFFWMAPHWYATVEQAYGLSPEDLQYARHVAILRDMQQMGNLARHVCFRESSSCVAVIAAAQTRNHQHETVVMDDSDKDTSNTMFWNRIKCPSDEERILESAPL